MMTRHSADRTNRILLALGLACLVAAGALAAPASSTEVELAWQRNWKNYARRCVKLRDNYYTCATYETQYPSSRGTTTTALRQKTAKEVTERFGSNAKIKKVLVRPNEEIELMAKSLPEVAVGHYGYVNSALILDILGPDEMVVAEMWLVNALDMKAAQDKEEERLLKAGIEKGDVKEVLEWMFESREEAVAKQRDKSFRRPVVLRGFSTVGLAKGERWTGRATDKDGVAIAIVGEHTMASSGKSKREITMPLAVPADLFNRGIGDEKEFLALLADRKFTKEMFVTLLQEEQKANPTDARLADAHIFAKLDGRDEKEEDEKPSKPKERKKPSF